MANYSYSVAANKNPPIAKNRVGTAAEHTTFTGIDGEITVVSDDYSLRIHDGSTAGGRTVNASSGASLASPTLTGTVNSSAATIVAATLSGTLNSSGATLAGPTITGAVIGATNTITVSTGDLVTLTTAVILTINALTTTATGFVANNFITITGSTGSLFYIPAANAAW